MSIQLPVARSINHLHILAILHSELRRQGFLGRGPIRILDAGCGNGEVIAFLMEGLAALVPGMVVELFGYDVNDYGVQLDNTFLDKTVSRLSTQFPDQPWSQRIHSIGQRQDWPFPNDYFNVVLSNQVVEHVRDLNFFFRQLQQVLIPGGFSVHLFPLKNYVVEGHMLLPFVHRVRSHDLRVACIRFLSVIGVGPYQKLRRRKHTDLSGFSEQMADYILHFTRYVSARMLMDTANDVGLRASFRYTREYYTQKMRRLLGAHPRIVYPLRSALVDVLAFGVLKYISSITFFLEKRQAYRGFGMKDL